MSTHPQIIQGPQGEAGAVHDPVPRIRIDSFIDYQCPYCRRFEHIHGPELQQLVDEGQVEWVLHPVAFLDELSMGNQYSTRAGGFAFGIAEHAPKQFGEYSNQAFWHQPKENTHGYPDSKLIEFATSVGVPEDAAKAALDPKYQEMVADVTQYALDLGVEGIPTVTIKAVDGERYLWDGETPFTEIVAKLGK
jgi:protein-disulfide isomerase